MVAYSFKQRFVEPITLGLEPGPWLPGMKRQTIRVRGGARRHARPGQELQLYTGMRTKACKLIGKTVCTSVENIGLDFVRDHVTIDRKPAWCELNVFARQDGFADWGEMKKFWELTHGCLFDFHGVIIYWEPKP
jgi:hypothetical protein